MKKNMFSEALETLGQQVADKAVEHEREAHENWMQMLTMFSLARSLGQGEEAFEALFAPAERMVQKKALWFRRQKSTMKQALALDVDISGLTHAEAAQKVEEAREEAKTPEERAANSLRMLQRSMKGAVTYGGARQAAKAVKSVAH